LSKTDKKVSLTKYLRNVRRRGLKAFAVRAVDGIFVVSWLPSDRGIECSVDKVGRRDIENVKPVQTWVGGGWHITLNFQKRPIFVLEGKSLLDPYSLRTKWVREFIGIGFKSS